MSRKILVPLFCLLAVVAGLSVPPAAHAEETVTPNLADLIPVYQQLKTDTKFIGLQNQLRGNLQNRAVVDRYLEFLPISPLSMLEIDMKLNRFEFKVPKLIWEWHMRWLDLHPQQAKKLYGVDQPAHELSVGLATTDAGAQNVTAAATVGTNRNSAYNYPLPPDEYQGEIQVAVNPNNASQVVSAANTWDDQNGTCGNGIQAVFFSADGGDTWGYTCPPLDVDYGMNCAQDFGGIIFGSDPALYWNDNNQVVLNHMLLCYDGANYHYSMVAALSSDGGATWQAQGVVINSWGTGNLEDKNFYTIDNNPASPFYGRHYTCWDRSNNEKSAYSTDNGQTWTEVDLPDTAGAASGCSAKGITSRYDLGCELEVGKDGTVHVVYDTITCGLQSCSCEQMFYSRSTNGGQSWSAPVQVRNFNLVAFSNDSTPDAQNQRGVGPFGAVAIDNSGGACDGTLYATFTDHTGGGANTADVWVSKSTDNGNTWGAPVKVNDDATSNIQFHPFLQVDQSNGNPVVAWHDARNDPNNAAVDIFAARSTNCGASFESNIQVTAPSAEFNNSTISWSNQNSIDNPSYNPNQYGEYLGLDVLNNTAYVAWSDSRHFYPSFTGDLQQENVGFAKVDLTFTAPTPTSLHVDSIALSTQNAGKGQKTAAATVTIVDNLGNPVAGAGVTGTFSGDVSGTSTVTTNASGVAVFTAGPAKVRAFGFCVDNVTHATLPYNSADNVQTCATF